MRQRHGVFFYGLLVCAGLLLYLGFISLLPQDLYLQLVRREATIGMSVTPPGAVTQEVVISRERTHSWRWGRKDFIYPLIVRRSESGKALQETRCHMSAADFQPVWDQVLEHHLLTFKPEPQANAGPGSVQILTIEWKNAAARARRTEARWNTPLVNSEAVDVLAYTLGNLGRRCASGEKLPGFPTQAP